MSSEAEQRLEALRVAQSELVSGNTDGRVYMRASPGAALFLTDRTVAIQKVSEQIKGTIKADNGGGMSK